MGSALRLGGFLLLVTGWAIVLTAVAILASGGARAAFVLAGMVVEIVGLALVFQSHRTREERG
jgi:hypothetical protein